MQNKIVFIKKKREEKEMRRWGNAINKKRGGRGSQRVRERERARESERERERELERARES
jgi:hypothetical protein